MSVSGRELIITCVLALITNSDSTFSLPGLSSKLSPKTRKMKFLKWPLEADSKSKFISNIYMLINLHIIAQLYSRNKQLYSLVLDQANFTLPRLI